MLETAAAAANSGMTCPGHSTINHLHPFQERPVYLGNSSSIQRKEYNSLVHTTFWKYYQVLSDCWIFFFLFQLLISDCNLSITSAFQIYAVSCYRTHCMWERWYSLSLFFFMFVSHWNLAPIRGLVLMLFEHRYLSFPWRPDWLAKLPVSLLCSLKAYKCTWILMNL